VIGNKPDERLKTPDNNQWRFFDGIISWMIGMALIFSAVPHLGNPYFFLGSVYAYQMLAPGLGQIIAIILPVMQLLVAVCLIGRVFLNAAHLAAFVMLTTFVVVQSTAFLRGLNISCGCFGPEHDTPIGWFTLSLIVLLFTLSVVRNFPILLGVRNSGKG
jgi:hypothetical protein